MRCCAGAVAVMLPLLAWADDPIQNVDAEFDKTGDKLVTQADWRKMSDAEHLAYAKASLAVLGMDPYSKVSKHQTRMQQYLEGLNAVYQ